MKPNKSGRKIRIDSKPVRRATAADRAAKLRHYEECLKYELPMSITTNLPRAVKAS